MDPKDWLFFGEHAFVDNADSGDSAKMYGVTTCDPATFCVVIFARSEELLGLLGSRVRFSLESYSPLRRSRRC